MAHPPSPLASSEARRPTHPPRSLLPTCCCSRDRASARLAAGAGLAALLEHRGAVVFGAVLAVTKVAQNDRHFLMGGTQQRQHFLVDLKRPLARHAADGGGDALQHIDAHRFAADAGGEGGKPARVAEGVPPVTVHARTHTHTYIYR